MGIYYGSSESFMNGNLNDEKKQKIMHIWSIINSKKGYDGNARAYPWVKL